MLTPTTLTLISLSPPNSCHQTSKISYDVDFLLSQNIRLHPEIASDTLGAFSASALAIYAIDLAREAESDTSLLQSAVSALEKAHSIYPHPMLLSHLAEVLDLARRPRDAESVRHQAESLESQRARKATDELLVSNLTFRL